jgi:hypothetical protein
VNAGTFRTVADNEHIKAEEWLLTVLLELPIKPMPLPLVGSSCYRRSGSSHSLEDVLGEKRKL